MSKKTLLTAIKKITGTLTVLALLTTPFFELQASSSKRQNDLRRLQLMDRVFQICLGRSLHVREVKTLLQMNRQEVAQYLRKNAEIRTVFSKRLMEFSGAYVGKFQSHQNYKIEQASKVFNPQANLESTLKQLNRNRHKGVLCTNESNSVCFARWLVGRTAPALGERFITANKNSIPSLSYEKLLVRMSAASLKLK